MKVEIEIAEHEWDYLSKLAENGDILGHYERIISGGTPIDQSISNDSMKVLEDIRKLIQQAIEEDKKYPKWCSGLTYALQIIDRYIKEHKAN
jgi:hypothetical protein